MNNAGDWQPDCFRGHDGESLYVWRLPASSANRPHLHFAHATGLNGRTYWRLLTPLREHFNIWAWDMRGHGRSGNALAGRQLAGWREYYDDLACLIDHIGEPILLAGHSVGGMSSVGATALRPELVRALLLLDPVIMGGAPGLLLKTGDALKQGHRHPLAAMAARRRSEFPSFEAAIESYRGRSIFKSFDDEDLRNYVLDGFTEFEDGVRLACLPENESRSFARTEAWPWQYLRKVRCPIHILAAERESTFNGAAARRFARMHRGAQIERIPGSTHMLPMEFADEVRSAAVSLHYHFRQ